MWEIIRRKNFLFALTDNTLTCLAYFQHNHKSKMNAIEKLLSQLKYIENRDLNLHI